MATDGDYAPSPWDWVRNQVEKYEASGGTKGNTINGMPILIVHNKGAKSGALRKTPLMRVEHDGEWAIVASIGGAPKHPNWYFNLLAYPDDVAVQDGPEVVPVTIREVTGDEKAQWWERAVEAWPDYAEYQKKTDREIPVVVLEPIKG